MKDHARFSFKARVLEQVAGSIAALALFACALLQLCVIVLRSVFDVGYVWLHDLVAASFAFAVVFAVLVAFFRDGHVRVDVATDRLSAVWRHRRDLLGLLLFALPLGGVVVWTSLPFAAASWAVLEGARDVGGLPGVFLIKSLVPLLGLFFAVGALALVWRRMPGP